MAAALEEARASAQEAWTRASEAEEGSLRRVKALEAQLRALEDEREVGGPTGAFRTSHVCGV